MSDSPTEISGRKRTRDLQVIVRNTDKKPYDNKSKTRVALTTIEMLLKTNPNAYILISVPTEVLKEQWLEELIKWRMFDNCRVEIIHSFVKTNCSPKKIIEIIEQTIITIISIVTNNKCPNFFIPKTILLLLTILYIL